MSHFNNEMKEELYTDHMKNIVKGNDTFDIIPQKMVAAGNVTSMDKVLYADINSYLADDLMPKVDIATMSVGLEGRSPFLDHEFMELTAKIPDGLKLRGLNQKKFILKKALEGFIPHNILYRPKMGFGIPLDSWFRGELKQYAYDTLLSKAAHRRGIFKPEAIKKILDTHTQSKANLGYYIWNLLTLELWFREFFD